MNLKYNRAKPFCSVSNMLGALHITALDRNNNNNGASAAFFAGQSLLLLSVVVVWPCRHESEHIMNMRYETAWSMSGS